MRVALDTNPLYTTQAGVARHIQGLMKGFSQLQRADLDIRPLAWEVTNYAFEQPQRALKTAYRELVWAPVVGRCRIRQWQADLLHSTVNCLIPPPKGVPQVLTMHDLAFLRYPKRFRRWQRWSWKRLLKRVQDVDRVICISRFSADEAVELIGLDREKIEIVHNGCDFSDGPPPSEAPPEGGVPPEFFLFVGSLEPGKNLALLREVYALAGRQQERLPPLMIVGARWEGVAHEGGPPLDWHYLGRQPDEALVYLYRRAMALVFPSKYEGFGLPVAEAMALGCPVVCSRVASLPEVGGEAALYAALQPEAYLKELLRLTKEPHLREELVEKGGEQARKFSWVRCARETVQVYESVVNTEH